MLNRHLLHYAYRTLEKSAVVPSDAASGGAGGMPPGGAGGAPPGMAPPGGGGAPPPPMDPAAAGGAPPGPPPGDPSSGDIAGVIRQAVQQGVQQATAGAGAGGQGGFKPQKQDINTVATDVYQLKKLLLGQYRAEGRDLPPDILDGPNRDPVTGMPSAAATGGSDPATNQPQGPQPQSAISPIEPMQGAFPMPGGAAGGGGAPAPPAAGAAKAASEQGAPRVGTPIPRPTSVSSHARAIAVMLSRRRQQ